MSTGRPFDDIRALTRNMPQPDSKAAQAVTQSLDAYANLSPLGRQGAYMEWLASWQGKLPAIERPLIAVFAGSHGAAQKVYGQDIVPLAQERVKSLTEGAAAVRGVSSSLQAAFKVFELGIEYPSEDFSIAPSLPEKDCAAAIAFGMEVVAEGADIIALGNAGFGSATAAAAIAYGLYGGAAQYWAGGQGEAAKSRVEIVSAGASLHCLLYTSPSPRDRG